MSKKRNEPIIEFVRGEPDPDGEADFDRFIEAAARFLIALADHDEPQLDVPTPDRPPEVPHAGRSTTQTAPRSPDAGGDPGGSGGLSERE